MSNDPLINLGKAKGRRSLDKVDGFATSVGPGTHFTGSIGGSGHCIVYGEVQGECDLAGTLVIGESGVWRGDIVAEHILIAGRVEGSIMAREKLEIISTAHIQGSLFSPVIAIAEGAIHEGEVHMGQVNRFVGRRESD